MKAVLFFFIGIFLGMLAIMFALYCILFISQQTFGAGIASGVFFLIFGWLSITCFKMYTKN